MQVLKKGETTKNLGRLGRILEMPGQSVVSSIIQVEHEEFEESHRLAPVDFNTKIRQGSLVNGEQKRIPNHLPLLLMVGGPG